MISDLISYFKDKKVLILGFGKEGLSTYKLIRKYLPKQHLNISDKNCNLAEQFSFLKSDNNLTIISGEKYLENLNNYDIIMKAPGVSFAYIDTTLFFH